jgi:hypothetical protein
VAGVVGVANDLVAAHTQRRRKAGSRHCPRFDEVGDRRRQGMISAAAIVSIVDAPGAVPAKAARHRDAI